MVLALREEESGALEAAAVTETAEAPVKITIKCLESWGLKGTVLVTEPATQAWMTAVKLARPEETVVTGTPRYDSKSKRACGERVPDGAGFIAHLGDVEGEMVTRTLSPSSHLVQVAGVLLDTPSWKMDLTPYRKLRRGEYGGAIAELGETVLFHAEGLNQKFPRRWE